jgi:F-type H+-transporting ATPase subunit b
MNLMLPDSGLLFWMTLIFLLVFFILAKFGFPVITSMVEKRTKRIDDALSAARKAEEAIAHLSQEQERIVAETKIEQAKIIQEAAAERDRMIASAQDQARLEAQKIIEEARARINEEKDAALKEARKELALISITIAEKVVRKELSGDAAQKELVDRFVDEIV